MTTAIAWARIIFAMTEEDLVAFRRSDEFDEVVQWLAACREHRMVESALERARGLLH